MTNLMLQTYLHRRGKIPMSVHPFEKATMAKRHFDELDRYKNSSTRLIVEKLDITTMYKFAAASENESIVFGSARPGYRDAQVNEWIEFMQNQHIKRVCCLLPDSQLARYSNLLGIYQQIFGLDQVCWAPIEDFHFADSKTLIHQVLPFLAVANQRNEKVVVHCSGGVGRTGHILAAWLVAGRGLSSQAAIASVKQTGKNPYEAVIAAPFKGRNPWRVAAELNTLLDECKHFTDKLT